MFAYLHGFLSGPDSVKGRHLQAFLKTLGVDLRLLDLNGDEGFAGELEGRWAGGCGWFNEEGQCVGAACQGGGTCMV